MTPDKFADRYTLLVKVSSYFVNITLTKKFARQRLLIILYKVGNKREWAVNDKQINPSQKVKRKSFCCPL